MGGIDGYLKIILFSTMFKEIRNVTYVNVICVKCIVKECVIYPFTL